MLAERGDEPTSKDMPRNTAYLPPSAPSEGVDEARRAFGDRVRVRMNQKGWSQSELARRAGLKRDSVSTYINGKVWPDPANLKKLAKTLGCATDELVPSIAAVAPTPPAVSVVNDGDGMHLRINKRVSFEQASRILSILSEDGSKLSLSA